MMIWAMKLAILALAILTIVPVSMKLSDYIYEVNQVTIEQKVEETVQPTKPEQNTEQQPDTRSWWDKLKDGITDAVDSAADALTNTAQRAIDEGKRVLNDFTDAVAVFVIAYCAIPVFVVFLFLWLLKILFGIKINAKGNKLLFRNAKEEDSEEEERLALAE